MKIASETSIFANMKYYKLLTQEMTSYNNTEWKLNETITVEKEGVEMCTDQVLHCYNHPLLAVVFNPIHANIKNPKLFEINVDKIVNTDGLKFASKSQTLIKEIPLPEISLEQRIEFGIRVVKLVYKDEKWNLWADRWLNGEDRSKESAATARAATYTATYAAANAANAASNAANAAYTAADHASRAAYTTDTDAIANSATCAAIAVGNAAKAVDDKNEFNRKIIDIIESICKHEYRH